MATAAKQLNCFLETHEALRKRRAGEPAWLIRLREEAWVDFCARGLPTTHDEDWRFTNVSALERIAFEPGAKNESAIPAGELEALRIANTACRLVFVNGHFAPALSDVRELPAGLAAGGLADAVSAEREGVDAHLCRYADNRRDPFVALNTALWEDGAYVRVERGANVEQPVHLLYLTTAHDAPVMTHPRTLVIAAATSKVALIEEYVSIGDGAAFSNSVTELIAGQDAVVGHFLVERENLESFNFSTLRIEQERGANVDSHSILLGGGLVRNNVHPVLDGEGAECLINGLFVGAGRQHLDNFMLVEHARPNCGSRQFYNGILDEQSRGVFHGRIVVHKDAQRTDAKQTNRNLLLSDDARIDTKPQLEIYADDVKCTHGATIGQIEEEALFYLRSRGLSETDARNLLLYAFAAECLDRMREAPAREFVETLIRDRLNGLAEAMQGRERRRSDGGQRAEVESQSWEEVG
jgi:Fe-S cluster assembly protein SufD